MHEEVRPYAAASLVVFGLGWLCGGSWLCLLLGAAAHLLIFFQAPSTHSSTRTDEPASAEPWAGADIDLLAALRDLLAKPSKDLLGIDSLHDPGHAFIPALPAGQPWPLSDSLFQHRSAPDNMAVPLQLLHNLEQHLLVCTAQQLAKTSTSSTRHTTPSQGSSFYCHVRPRSSNSEQKPDDNAACACAQCEHMPMPSVLIRGGSRSSDGVTGHQGQPCSTDSDEELVQRFQSQEEGDGMTALEREGHQVLMAASTSFTDAHPRRRPLNLRPISFQHPETSTSHTRAAVRKVKSVYDARTRRARFKDSDAQGQSDPGIAPGDSGGVSIQKSSSKSSCGSDDSATLPTTAAELRQLRLTAGVGSSHSGNYASSPMAQLALNNSALQYIKSNSGNRSSLLSPPSLVSDRGHAQHGGAGYGRAGPAATGSAVLGAADLSIQSFRRRSAAGAVPGSGGAHQGGALSPSKPAATPPDSPQEGFEPAIEAAASSSGPAHAFRGSESGSPLSRHWELHGRPSEDVSTPTLSARPTAGAWDTPDADTWHRRGRAAGTDAEAEALEDAAAPRTPQTVSPASSVVRGEGPRRESLEAASRMQGLSPPLSPSRGVRRSGYASPTYSAYQSGQGSTEGGMVTEPNSPGPSPALSTKLMASIPGRNSNLLTIDNAIPENSTFAAGQMIMMAAVSVRSNTRSPRNTEGCEEANLAGASFARGSGYWSPGGSPRPSGSFNTQRSSMDRSSVQQHGSSNIYFHGACLSGPSPFDSRSNSITGPVRDSNGTTRSASTGLFDVEMLGFMDKANDAHFSMQSVGDGAKQEQQQHPSNTASREPAFASVIARGSRTSNKGSGPLLPGSTASQQPIMTRTFSDEKSLHASFPARAPSTVARHRLASNRAQQADNVELEVEEAVLLNRRMLDAKLALLDEVKLESVLGFGSMGMIYFGTLWSARVVVKLIEHNKGNLNKEQKRAKLARIEAVVSRMLLHPNVVITYACATGPMDASKLKSDMATTKRQLGGLRSVGKNVMSRGRVMTMMIQEFCDQGTLRDALQKDKLKSLVSAEQYPLLIAQLALDVAEGIRYMHSLRILHVDLKAENILLQQLTNPRPGRHSNLVAKVADFGLALVLPPDTEFREDGVHGTISHMPPEALRNPVFSFATDVYSFGIVLWEMVTKDVVFKGMPGHQVANAVCEQNARPAWPEDLHPTFHVLAKLATDCWDTSPVLRPAMDDVIERLQTLLNPQKSKQLPSRGASMMSKTTEESDELEAALAQQRKAAAQAAQAIAAAMLSNSGRTPRGSVPGSEHGVPQSQNSGLDMEGIHPSMSQAGTVDNNRYSQQGPAENLTLQEILARPPPKDTLGRMLYYLAQMPPSRSSLQRVSQGHGNAQFVVPVGAALLNRSEREAEEAELRGGSGAPSIASPLVQSRQGSCLNLLDMAQ